MEDSEEEYNMRNTFRGNALIIANEKFNAGIANRSGARQDALKMQTLFKALDFKVITYMDLTAAQMETAIKTASDSLVNLDADCFVLVISSHGHEEQVSESQWTSHSHMYLPNNSQVWRHAIQGVDGQNIFVDDMLEIFDDKKNPKSYLSGKPKLFFLQACRSGHLTFRDGDLASSFDRGINIKVKISDANLSQMQPSDAGIHDDMFIETVNKLAGLKLSTEAENAIDGCVPEGRVTFEDLKTSSPVEMDTNPVEPRSSNPSSYDIIPLACPEDCLVMYPAVAGKNAFRRNETGSYMLHYMFHETNRNLLLQGCDILQYVTSVNKAMCSTEDITFDGHSCKMTACITHRLLKTLKFQPRRDHSVLQDLKARKTF